jgi:tetratricopeptide (TPR) repeat protein
MSAAPDPSAEYLAFSYQLEEMAAKAGSPRAMLGPIKALAMSVRAANLPRLERAYLLFTCSSLTINAGMDGRDREALESGRDWAIESAGDAVADSPFAQQCKYNVANANLELAELTLPVGGGARASWEPLVISSRLGAREALRDVRKQLLDIAEHDATDPHTRSAAYCNLANALDTSGRWAEAYGYYLSSLEASPDNGNAAGNLAQLLLARLHSGIGHSGHIAAVYDHYARMARDLTEGAARFAGDKVAARWEKLQLTESQGHLSHGTDTDDGYRLWVADHRLALAPVVEGLGTDSGRWDTAAVEALYTPVSQREMPAVYGSMNVLKADFLVSRRLAYEGIAELVESDLRQLASDPGYYIETRDYSLYGIQYSKLLLAQRSTLDVLDKTAVVANEHFESGVPPHRVAFRDFWMTGGDTLRASLVSGPGRSLPALALSELALDLSPGGMYEISQSLRNAGTHRIVHAALLDATGVTRQSRSSIELHFLVNSTLSALTVTRAAYLYLIDLIAMWNEPGDHPGDYMTVPNSEYLLADPDSNAGTTV